MMARLLPSCATAVVLVITVGATIRSDTGPRGTAPAEVGNEACRPCHQAIYDSYSRTAMARTSGHVFPAREGSFRHGPSGVSYRVFRDGPRAILSYERAGDTLLRGSQVLKYFLGSNTRGTAPLFDIEGFLYMSPVNYYAGKAGWDMSPGYAQTREMELNHPVDATCLFCHASRVQPTRTGTLNAFDGAPFLQDGVGCERCHGAGRDHVDGGGAAAMVNPAKLTGERRDGICMQCHLEGEVRIARAGQSPENYRPGERLSDYMAIFVRESDAQQRRAAVSHVESLAISACQRGSAGALSCITCHDPHVQPGATEKPGHYRGRCLECHAALADGHYTRQQDCTACHMPRLESADISHTVVTDHRILRERQESPPRPPSVEKLVQFGNTQPESRDLGIAYAHIALRGNTFAASEALRLLTDALRRHPDDAEVLTRLAYLYQARGDMVAAEKLYAQVLERDPDHAVAAANLGVFHARRGGLPRALELWRTTFDRNPQLSGIGVNLGTGLCAVGDAKGARAVLERVLKHNPDLGVARQALAQVVQRGCSPN